VHACLRKPPGWHANVQDHGPRHAVNNATMMYALHDCCGWCHSLPWQQHHWCGHKLAYSVLVVLTEDRHAQVADEYCLQAGAAAGAGAQQLDQAISKACRTSYSIVAEQAVITHSMQYSKMHCVHCVMVDGLERTAPPNLVDRLDLPVQHTAVRLASLLLKKHPSKYLARCCRHRQTAVSHGEQHCPLTAPCT
jgi:hypothetical protein